MLIAHNKPLNVSLVSFSCYLYCVNTRFPIFNSTLKRAVAHVQVFRLSRILTSSAEAMPLNENFVDDGLGTMLNDAGVKAVSIPQER